MGGYNTNNITIQIFIDNDLKKNYIGDINMKSILLKQKLNESKTILKNEFFQILLFLTLPFSVMGGTISGTFTTLASCPMNLTCFTCDPTTGYFYGQGDQGSTNYYRYNASSNTWTSLASCPQASGNNGGATYLKGKIYNSYCSYNVLTIYTISTNTWTTISGGVNSGSISTDGTDIYCFCR